MPPLIKPITGQVDQTAGGLKDETGIKKKIQSMGHKKDH